MGTVRPKVFKAKDVDASRSGEIVNYTVKNAVTSKVELVRKEILGASGAIKIEDAEISCSGWSWIRQLLNISKCSKNWLLYLNMAVLGGLALLSMKVG